MQTKSEIQAALDAAGVRPKKKFGQHFLIDGNLMRRLVASAELTPNDVVLEVGAGTGSLTEMLAELAGHVVAVEVDRNLFPILQQRLANAPAATLLQRDALETKSHLAGQVLDELARSRSRLGGRILLVANLPYQIASPLIIDLLVADLTVERMCFTIQVELAQRILAEPNTKAYGPLSIVLQAAGSAQRIAHVPRQAFWPLPRVDSAMLRLDVEAELQRSVDLRELAALVRAGFRHRRKTLAHNLKEYLGQPVCRQLESDGGFDLGQRPEQLSVEGWVRLSRAARRSGRAV